MLMYLNLENHEYETMEVTQIRFSALLSTTVGQHKVEHGTLKRLWSDQLSKNDF